MKSPRWVVAVGASAGGVEALRDFFAQVPRDIDAAFLVVMHIPPHSPSQLHQVLGGCTSLEVCAAGDRQRLKAGHVYVARADLHLMTEGDVIRLTRGPKECRARPSVDVLLRSAAVSHGPRAVGIVLSGMLDDGTAGLWAIKDAGGTALVQDPAEALYPSMPQSAIDHVDVDVVAPVRELARAVGRIAAEPEPASTASVSPFHATENEVANEGNALALGVLKMGEVSSYTCPDCHGVLVQIREGAILRFRCHTGHAFSLLTLLAEVGESIDKGLWDTIRAVEERLLLLRQLQELSDKAGRTKEAREYDTLAHETELRIQPLRALALDEQLFGRQR
jgi:two-component system chemotaxis response regulator CheB